MLYNDIIYKILLLRHPHPIAKILSLYCDRYKKPCIEFLNDQIMYIIPSYEQRGYSFINYINEVLRILNVGCEMCHKKSYWKIISLDFYKNLKKLSDNGSDDWYRVVKHTNNCNERYKVIVLES